jgi:hypothetical protein
MRVVTEYQARRLDDPLGLRLWIMLGSFFSRLNFLPTLALSVLGSFFSRLNFLPTGVVVATFLPPDLEV